MNILLIGSGGREHALAWKLAQSRQVEKMFAAPGNPGIAEHAEIAAIDPGDRVQTASFAVRNNIDLVVIGPEQPLVDGLADTITVAGIPVFGPGAHAAQLEGSKQFTKGICAQAGVPTANSAYFTDVDEAAFFIKRRPMPIVVKADGLAAGKGVTVAKTVDEALAANSAIFSAGPSASVVIEECLAGTEASLFALSDGETVIPFGTAQDYKRAYDGDGGPNTGGMGAISPAPALTPEMLDRAMDEIVRPTVAAMRQRGIPYRGVLYAGLMITDEGPKLIEYNVRFGDPECQVLMPRLQSDLAELLLATATGQLAGAKPEWSDDAAVTVTLATRGYPGAYQKGSEIKGVKEASSLPGVTVFQAGTATEDGHLLASGGRVLNVTATGKNAQEARERAYAGVATIDWPQGFHRKDIAAGY